MTLGGAVVRCCNLNTKHSSYWNIIELSILCLCSCEKCPTSRKKGEQWERNRYWPSSVFVFALTNTQKWKSYSVLCIFVYVYQELENKGGQ